MEVLRTEYFAENCESLHLMIDLRNIRKAVLSTRHIVSITGLHKFYNNEGNLAGTCFHIVMNNGDRYSLTEKQFNESYYK